MVDLYVGPDHTHWVLHEKLLCARSQTFKQVFAGKRSSKALLLPDEEPEPFALLVAWLYSGRIPSPTHEDELGALLELHLMAERWSMPALARAVLDVMRDFYRRTDSVPSLRRLQFVYANADVEDSALRQLMVASVARMLVLGERVPLHWERALSRDGPMAVDIIRAVQAWRLEPGSVPDVRRGEDRKAVEVSNGVEAEEMPDEASVGERERSELDAAAAAPRDVERLVSGMKGVPNGVSWHH
jgi:hypothetical protein